MSFVAAGKCEGQGLFSGSGTFTGAGKFTGEQGTFEAKNSSFVAESTMNTFEGW